jgi:ABC-type Fe3+ transport system substrate-binding protein
MRRLGTQWFDALLAQNPRWVRGTETPSSLIRQTNNTYAASFVGLAGLAPDLNNTFATDAPFVTWPQTAAILKDAPHPESAKLLHNFLVSKEWLEATRSWSVRTDMPDNFPNIFEEVNTDPTEFGLWMADRTKVERLRFWFEKRIGSAQGLSPLIDDL